MNNLQDLISSGYGGYTGWNETEALGDFNATGGQGKYTGAGGASPDISSVPSVQSYNASLQGSEDTALNNLITQMEGRDQPLNLYRQFQEEAGLPELRNTSKTLSGEIANIEDIISGIPSNVTETTRNSFVNQGQRENIINAKRQPQVEALTKLSTNLGRISNLITASEQGAITATELAIRGQEMGLEPYQLKYSALVDSNARKLSAFTADRQTTLDALYAKWDRQNELDDREWQLAAELSSQEDGYVKELQKAAATAGANISGGETTDQLLTMIGQAAREEIARQNKTKDKEPTDKEVTKSRLEGEVSSGLGFKDAILRYGDELSRSEIRSIYDDKSWYGPAKESEEDILRYLADVNNSLQPEE